MISSFRPFVAFLFVVLTVLAPSRKNETLASEATSPGDVAESVSVSKTVSRADGSSLDPDTGITLPNDTRWEHPRRLDNVSSARRSGFPGMPERPRVRKCCPRGSAIDGSECVAYDRAFRIEDVLDGDVDPVSSTERARVLFDNPCKTSPVNRLPRDGNLGDAFYIRREDGRLLKGNESYETNEYCVDYFLDVRDYDAYLCPSANRSDTAFLDALFDSAGYMCLSGTILISLSLLAFLVSTELTTLYSWSIVSYYVSYLLLYVTNTVVCMDGGKMPIHVCYPIALTYIYGSLARLFWLNVMCIEITLKFRTIRSLKKSNKLADVRKFVLYSIYAWGGSLAVIIVIILAENFTRSDHVMKPNIGGLYCWIQGKLAGWILYGGPVAVLFLANSILFFYTFHKIFGHRRDTSILRNKKQDKRRFTLYMKLMIVMGIPTLVNIAWLFALPIIAFLVICYVCVLTETAILVSIAFTAKARARIVNLITLKPKSSIGEKGTINF